MVPARDNVDVVNGGVFEDDLLCRNGEFCTDSETGDPSSRAIRINATISPLEGGWAGIESISGKGYGQLVR